MPLNKELLDVLACPECHGAFVPLPAGDGLLCRACDKVFPIKDDIPILLPDEAVPAAAWTGSKAD